MVFYAQYTHRAVEPESSIVVVVKLVLLLTTLTVMTTIAIIAINHQCNKTKILRLD